MLETFPVWAQLGFWGIIVCFTHFLAFVAGYENAKKFWSGLLNTCLVTGKEQAITYRDRVAELADKVGGKCPSCKGWGVVGEDGSSDCMTCCGTGVRDLSDLADQNTTILKRAIADCDATKKRLGQLLPPNPNQP